jgi:hypothetical protein
MAPITGLWLKGRNYSTVDRDIHPAGRASRPIDHHPIAHNQIMHVRFPFAI